MELMQQFKQMHPLHALLIAGGVYYFTKDKKIAGGVGIGLFAYMSKYGHMAP